MSQIIENLEPSSSQLYRYENVKRL